MNLPPDVLLAALRVAIAGGIAGLAGGLIGSRRAGLFSSFLMGALGGIALASIVNISGLDPFGSSFLLNAGEGFSYAWGTIGGAFLGYVVTKSSGGAGKSKMWNRK